MSDELVTIEDSPFDYYNGTTTDIIGDIELMEKKDLVGKPMILLGVVFRPSERGSRDYVSVKAVTKEGGYVIFNDGSTGIRRQLLGYCVNKGYASWQDEFENLDRNAEQLGWGEPAHLTFDEESNVTISVPIQVKVPRGLRLSEYDYTSADGKKSRAETYYLG
jgi:hypothetical protein